MSSYSHALTMPWTYSVESDDRFQRILRINLALCLLFSLAIPFLPLPERDEPVIEEPPRLATLILEVKPVPPPPKPKPVPKPLPKKVTQPDPKPVQKKAVSPKKTVTPAKPASKVAKAAPPPPKPVPVKPKVTARQQAQKSGLLALQDSLADMRQDTASSSLRKTSQLSNNGGQARTIERAVLTAGTTRSSGGIQTASLSRNTGGGKLASRSTTQVHSPSGGSAASGGTVGNSDRGERTAGRSIEEIQMVFDRNKGAIYSVYNRALRKDPSLQGKVVLQLTIAPSGTVTHCELVSSELHDAALGQKITQRVKLFTFEAKDVNEVTITYPIDFLPA